MVKYIEILCSVDNIWSLATADTFYWYFFLPVGRQACESMYWMVLGLSLTHAS